MQPLLQRAAMSIIQPECVFIALGIQHAMRMNHVAICDLSCSTEFFSTLSHQWHEFRGGELLNTKCVFFYFLYNFCVTHFSFQEEMDETWSKMSSGLHVKYLLFLSDFNETWTFSTVFFFFEKYSSVKFMKVRPVGAELFHVGGRMDGQTWRS